MPTHMSNHTWTVYRDSNPGTVADKRDSLQWDEDCITVEDDAFLLASAICRRHQHVTFD